MELPLYSDLRNDRRPLIEQLPLAVPHALFVEVASRCNFKCGFCPQSLDAFKGGELMDVKLYEKIIADMTFLDRIKVLRLYGTGESTLHRWLPQMVQTAADADVAERIELTTNGTGPISLLLGAGLDYLRVSLYGMRPDKHLEFTGNHVEPARILRNVMDFMDRRGKGNTPQVCAKMTDPDSDEEKLFRELWGPVVDEIFVEHTHAWSGQREMAQATFPVQKMGVCPSPFHTMFVHADGDVGSCCVDWSKQTVVGNLKEESLREIWEGDRLASFRRMHLERRRSENAACRDCRFTDTMPAVDNIDDYRGPI